MFFYRQLKHPKRNRNWLLKFMSFFSSVMECWASNLASACLRSSGPPSVFVSIIRYCQSVVLQNRNTDWSAFTTVFTVSVFLCLLLSLYIYFHSHLLCLCLQNNVGQCLTQLPSVGAFMSVCVYVFVRVCVRVCVCLNIQHCTTGCCNQCPATGAEKKSCYLSSTALTSFLFLSSFLKLQFYSKHQKPIFSHLLPI